MLDIIRIPDYFDMFFTCLILSLKITAIHVACFEGNIFYGLKVRAAEWFDWSFGYRLSRILQKPVYDCLPCMASLWTILFTWSFDIGTILIVCGINVIIESKIDYDRPQE